MYLGQNLRGVDHVGRFVAFAAPALRRKIRRVRLHQQTVQRHGGGDVADILRFREGQNAGEGNITAEFDTGFRQAQDQRRSSAE